MTHTSGMQLNKLNYDRQREIIEFSMRSSFDDTAIIISGEVPVRIIDAAGLRSASKAAVRQALLDAANALAEATDEDEVDLEADEGMRPEDLNATNDD